ncbi:MAG: 2-oxo acid dehydrogenase subunit E2 [Candidatus Latescibacterota bacterium]|nr:2-oxo acid dehydrogenase subunit E2 [Candidatus Latescibacterota bacterium]
MQTEFKMPDLGENIEGGDVVSVLVAKGDEIKEDQPIIELETDKAVVEVPSSISGKIIDVHISEGDSATIGQLLITVETENTSKETLESSPQTPQSDTETSVDTPAVPDPPAASTNTTEGSKTIEFVLPDLGENIEGGEVVAIMVSIGDQLRENQPVVELETDKAVVEVPSSINGNVSGVNIKEGDTVAVGQTLITVETETDQIDTNTSDNTIAEPLSPTDTEKTSPTIVESPILPSPKETSLIPAAPSVRRLAREIGVNISEVSGSGSGGRISKDDVKAYSKLLHQSKTVGTSSSASVSLPDFSQWGGIEHQPMSKVRRITAERLTQATITIPMVTQFDKADVTDLEKWRKEHGKRAEAAGGKLTPTAILIKVLGAALKAFPQFNASIDIAQNEIIYKKYCNIGIAVDTEHGLMVPVVRDVDQKNIIELSVELSEMAEKTRDRKISPSDLQGGCITISNVGVMGGTAFTPIVNPPEVAILGVARSSVEAIHIDGEFQPRTMMPLSLTYDHRLIDGADGARFLRWICEALQNPFVVLLEG